MIHESRPNFQPQIVNKRRKENFWGLCLGAKLTKSILIGNHFSDFVKRKTEDCLFWWVHMEKKNSNMSKKEEGFVEQNQEGDNHHQHVMHSQVKKIKEE